LNAAILSRLGIVGTGNRVTFRPVKVVDSDRKKVRLSGGLSVGEKVVLNPGSGISDEELAQTVEAGGK
jgi:hypothetical protein